MCILPEQVRRNSAPSNPCLLYTSHTPPPPALGNLTPRELEIFKLVARGLSNAEIAGRLFLSNATVKTHVTRALTKLGLRDRAQAVVLAYETAIVRPGEQH